MGGIGLALVLARGGSTGSTSSSWLGRATRATCRCSRRVLVLGFGLYLTIQAVSGATVL